jgi:hypothetical protein
LREPSHERQGHDRRVQRHPHVKQHVDDGHGSCNGSNGIAAVPEFKVLRIPSLMSFTRTKDIERCCKTRKRWYEWEKIPWFWFIFMLTWYMLDRSRV